MSQKKPKKERKAVQKTSVKTQQPSVAQDTQNTIDFTMVMQVAELIWDGVKDSLGFTARIAVIGQTNAGKSALINALFLGEEIAPEGQVSDLTKDDLVYKHPKLNIELIDLPGYGGELLTDIHLQELLEKHKPHIVLHLISAFSGAFEEDAKIRQWLLSRIAPQQILTVLTQVDRLDDKDELEDVIEATCETLGITRDELFCVDSKTYTGLKTLAATMMERVPMHAKNSLATQLEVNLFLEEKTKQAKNVVKIYSAIAAGIGAIPIPVADMPILLALQSDLLRRIGKIFNEEALTELIFTIFEGAGAALVLRYIARQLIKLIPAWGWVASGSVAFAGTYALGVATIEYLNRKIKGKEMSKAELNELINNAKKEGKALYNQMKRDGSLEHIQKEYKEQILEELKEYSNVNQDNQKGGNE